MGLIRSLPQAVVEEQIRLHRQQQREGAAAVAEKKIRVSKSLTVQERTLIAKRFEAYCQRNGLSAKLRLPHGAMKTFVVHHLDCSARGGRFPTQHIRKWHLRWLAETSGGNTIAAQGPKSLLKSRARKPLHCRARARGAGRPFQAPLVRQALYEWWSSIRYTIDWKELIAARRSRGRKNNLARFPRAVLRMKAIELFESHATQLC